MAGFDSGEVFGGEEAEDDGELEADLTLSPANSCYELSLSG